MRQVGWLMVLAVAAVQVLAGGAMLLGDVRATFEGDTGVRWEALEAAYPTVTAQFEIANRASLAGTLVVGLYSVLVCVFALRTAQRWSWFALWLLPVFMLPGIVGLLGTDNQQAFGYFGLGLVAVAVVGLLLSIPGVLVADRPGSPPDGTRRAGVSPSS
ncbi:hypothetical protein [Agromyces sp. SYSU T0242]|uniref:hypothetical protein n=1 Tax=Agromyces litoreus TaxID=3158561 RepID=UPI0033984F0F